MPKQQEPHTVIVGAGLTGLSTAYYLKKQGVPFTVLERNALPGGVIQTRREKGFTYELGPNTGVIGSSEIAELFEDLHPLCQLETAREQAKNRYILKNGHWNALPTGLWAAIRTPLFTFSDKLRLLGEPFRRKGKNPHETLSQLVIRRMGKSFLDYAIDPFIIGVYAGDPDLLIPKYALPKLYRLEQIYGSFIGGALKKQWEKKTEAEKKITRKVFSAKGGLCNLVEALYSFGEKENFQFQVQNLKIQPQNKGFLLNWTQNQKSFEANARNVIFTGGSFDLPGLLPFVDAGDMQKITRLQYARIIEVTLGFTQWQGIPLDGFGGLIPSREKRDVLGVLYMSTLFSGRAPKGGALLTVFMGGMRNMSLATLPDEQIRKIVERELTSLMQLPAFDPVVFYITRYDYAIPQYDVRSGVRFETIARLEKQYPGLILGGNMRDGIGMADRVKQAKMLAQQVIPYKA